MILKSKTFKKLIACMLCLMLLIQPFALPNVFAATSGTVTGFESIERNGYTYTYDMTEQDVASTLPRTINVYLDNDEISAPIDVNWKCTEDFGSKKLFAYTFVPTWNTDQYPLSLSLSQVNIPAILVTPEDASCNLSGSTDEVAPNSNEDVAYNFFKNNLGLRTSSACAMLQNLYSESGIMPNNVENRCPYTDEEYTRMVDNGTYGREEFASDEYGYGLCQWTSYGRKYNLYNAATGKSIADMNMQLNFLAGELKNNFPTTWATLCKVPNSDMGTYLAASVMCFDFESPAYTVDTSVTRGKYAVEDYWKKYGGSYDLAKPYLGICGYSYPTKLNRGTGMGVSGVVSSNYPINSVKATISTSGGSTVYTGTASPGKCLYDLAHFDDDLLFSNLSSGNYNYNITAKDSSGKTISTSKSFSVGSSGTNIEYDVATSSGPVISSSVYSHDSTILSWAKSKNPDDKYLIYRGTSIEGDWGSAIAELSNSTTSYIDNNNGKGLQTGKKYYYMMRTVDKSSTPWEYSDYSNKDYAVPNVPNILGFSACAVNETSCRTDWNKTKSSAMQYWIYRGEKPSGDWGAPIAKLSNSNVTYTDKDLKMNKKYYYMMRAVEISGSKKYYGNYTKMDYGVTRDPVIDSFSAKGIDKSTCELNWTKNKDKSSYRVYRSLDGNDWYWIDEVKNDVTTYRDKNLKIATTYYYKVCGVCYVDGQAYFGRYSKVDYGRPGILPPNNFKSAAKTSSSSKISWDRTEDHGLRYLIYRGTKPSGDWGNAIKDLSNDETSWEDTNLCPGTRYYYMMRSYIKINGKTYFSNYTDIDYASPKVTNISGFYAYAPNSVSAKVCWDKASDPNIKFLIYRGTKPSGDWGNAIAKCENGDVSYLDEGVLTGTKYYYMMRPMCTVNGVNYFGEYTKIDYAYPR